MQANKKRRRTAWLFQSLQEPDGEAIEAQLEEMSDEEKEQVVKGALRLRQSPALFTSCRMGSLLFTFQARKSTCHGR